MTWTFDNGVILMKAALVGGFNNNAYVVACARTGKGVIIDAAAEPDRVLEMADGVDIQAILTTHGHPDHLQAVDAVVEELGVPFRLHRKDHEMAAKFGGAATSPVDLADGETIPLGEASLLTLHTPGHTEGSVCFLSPGVIFSGDTLFPGGPGATSFDIGYFNDRADFGRIMESIEVRLFRHPRVDDDAEFYPGHSDREGYELHGPRPSTVGAVRPLLEEWRERGW